MAALLHLCVITQGSAQVPPSNGYIGIFEDMTRTTGCCIELPSGNRKDLEIFAVLGGETAQGVTQAEFRIDFDSLDGYLAVWAADPAAALALGSAVHSSSQQDNWGANVAFSTCQGAMAGDALHLGTVSIFNINGLPTDMWVTRRLPPTDPNHDCPTLVLCDAPTYTQVCLTSQTPPSGPEPIIYKVGLNRGSACDPNHCGVVAVKQNTWSLVKGTYR